MTSLPKTMEKQFGNADLCETKQIIHHSKGIDESYPKMYFLLNLSYYVKGCGHFCQILAFFYNARSPNMVMSRGPRSKFRKFSCFPNSAFNIRKSYKISSGKALYFRSYQPKYHSSENEIHVVLSTFWFYVYRVVKINRTQQGMLIHNNHQQNEYVWYPQVNQVENIRYGFIDLNYCPAKTFRSFFLFPWKKWGGFTTTALSS